MDEEVLTSAENEVNHVDGINIVKEVVASAKTMVDNPAAILETTTNFFGDALVVNDILAKLRAVPTKEQFVPMMRACLVAVIQVLERQYERYFSLDITEMLR